MSFVIPNLDNDMHDGTVAAGDSWLQANLDGYARWARGHNSLLIVTFDECAGSDPVATTPIATIFVGASVRSVVSPQRLTLYSLLRLVEEIYGLPSLGQEASRRGSRRVGLSHAPRAVRRLPTRARAATPTETSPAPCSGASRTPQGP